MKMRQSLSAQVNLPAAACSQRSIVAVSLDEEARLARKLWARRLFRRRRLLLGDSGDSGVSTGRSLLPIFSSRGWVACLLHYN